jgi:glycosyltransferase involved in cell wall biosynthesis
MPELRVLLIAPTYRSDPFCGDVTITESIMNSTAENIDFIAYDQAVMDKSLRDIVRNPISLLEVLQSIFVKLLNRLRQPLRLFREDFRLYEVDSTKYDLLHVFVFPVNVSCTGKKIPIVYSQAISNRRLYLDARKWSIRHYEYARCIEEMLATLFRVENPNLSRLNVDLYLAYTQFHADEVKGAVRHSDLVCVWHPFIPLSPSSQLTENAVPKFRIGFVAKDFVSKGGALVCNVVSLLRSAGYQVELHIAGSPAPSSEDWIVSYGSISHRDMFERFYANVDIMLYPTKFDGWPLVVAEAQASGVPVFVSSYCGVPDMVPNQDFIIDSYDAETWMLAVSKYLSADLSGVKHAVKVFASTKFGETTVMRELVAHYRGLIDCK